MLLVVEERLEGLKYNIDFWGGVGVITQGEGLDMSTLQKRIILWKCRNTFVSHYNFIFVKRCLLPWGDV